MDFGSEGPHLQGAGKRRRLNLWLALNRQYTQNPSLHSLLSVPEIPFNNQSLLNDIRQGLFHNIRYRFP
jgi:hypothetical protein